MNNKGFLSIVIVILVIVLVGAVGYLIWNQQNQTILSEPPVRAGVTVPQIVNVEGETVCLPHKAGGPSPEECAYGLKGSRGEYYGLNFGDIKVGDLTTHTKVHVSGILLSSNPASTYDIVGTIKVDSFVRIDNGKTGDATAGWKTYRNEKYGFEVKYPSSWSVDEQIGGYSSTSIGNLNPELPRIAVKFGKLDYSGRVDIETRYINLACQETPIKNQNEWKIESVKPFVKQIMVGGQLKTIQSVKPTPHIAEAVSYHGFVCNKSGIICYDFYSFSQFDQTDIDMLSTFKTLKDINSWDATKCILSKG